MSTPQQAPTDAESIKQRVETARESAQKLLDARWPLAGGSRADSSHRDERLRNAVSPSQPQGSPALPLPQTDIPHLLEIVGPLLDWCQHSQGDLAAVASELPYEAWPSLYAAPKREEPGVPSWYECHASELDGHYIVCIRVRDQHGDGDGVTFPLIVIPRRVAHIPWKQDKLDDPLGTYRPERFAGSTVLVKHGLLVLVCDLLIRPFGLPPGSFSIDDETNVCTYDIVVPDSYDMARVVQPFVQTFLYSPRLCASSDESRKRSVEQLKERDPVCPVTLVPGDADRQGTHLIDKNLGGSMFHVLSQGLHDEAKNSGRYGDLLQPWESHQWIGDNLDQPINQVFVLQTLNKPIDHWAFLSVLEHPHEDEVVCDDILHYHDQWAKPIERRLLPSYVFLNFDPSRLLCSIQNYELQWGRPSSGNGLSTVWFPPDEPFRSRASSTETCLPRPPHWFPAHADFPPPFLMNNTVASRLIKCYRSYAVAGLASRIPRKRSRAFYEPSARSPSGRVQLDNAHGVGAATSVPANDAGADGAAASVPAEHALAGRGNVPASQPSDTAALVAFALLALAAAYAVDDEDSEDEDEDADFEADSGWEELDFAPNPSIHVKEWLRSTSSPGPDDVDGTHEDAEPTVLPAPARSLSQGRSSGHKRGAEDAAGGDQKRTRRR